MSIQEEIKSAVAAHGMWKARLRNAIDKGVLEIPVATIKVDNQCAFGKWLYGASITPNIRGTKEYQAVKEAHAEFHLAAAKVAELAQVGNKAEANAHMEMGGEFAKISVKLTRAMMDWEKAAP